MASLGIYKSDLIVSGDRKEKGNKSQLRQPVGGVGWGGVEGMVPSSVIVGTP